MKNILIKSIGWVFHNIGILFFIFVILIIGKISINYWNEYKSVLSEYSLLIRHENKILSSINSGEKYAKKQNKEYEDKVKKADILKSGNVEAVIVNISDRINTLDINIRDKEIEKQKYNLVFEVISGKPISEAQLSIMRLAVEKKILEKERLYLSDIRIWLTEKITERDNINNLEKLRIIHLSVYDELKRKIIEIDEFKMKNSYRWMVPFTKEHQFYSALKNSKDILLENNNAADVTYKEFLLKIKRIPKSYYPSDFKVEESDFYIILAPVRDRLIMLTQKQNEKWIGKLMMDAKSVSSMAFQILFFIIVTPFFIKALFYFILAPIASRRPPVRLLPHTPGDFSLETGHSSVAQTISVDGKSELLIHPEFLQSSSIEGTKETQWLLDWQYPLTSLASNMVALTRIRTAIPATFVLSATNDPFSEVGILSIPQGAAIVMQPHNLVGVRQPIGMTVRITSHWRLNSLHAWLTLQLRYLAFHGPVDLVVQGCRGVRVEKADSGRSINQAATIGFSANLSYATRRCETFSAYLLGKQELLNDVFDGEKGFYVYEEMPHFGKKTGLTGRGLEGFTDSMLKVLGI